jgi:hypothetical protein
MQKTILISGLTDGIGIEKPCQKWRSFYLIFKMSTRYVKSNFELQNLRWWQALYSRE